MKEFIKAGLKDILITLAIVSVATLVSAIFLRFSASELPIYLIFVLAVLIISRLTDGLICGVVTSIVAVFIINFVFTYPFMAFNFTIAGYPFTFITLFVVSIITSTLTSQIKQQQKLRAEAEREKLYADFLRSISHDIRTPLTSIVGSTSAILDSELQLSEDQKLLLLSEIRDDASWLIRMIENILSVTRVRGEMKIKKTREPVEEIVGEIIGKFRKRYPEAPVFVSIPDELVFVFMDATLIEQVIINLLENAAVHGKGATRIVFSVKIEGEEAIFSVENDGDMIDTAVMRKLMKGDIFSPDRVGGADSRRSLGIGLSVCASIVKAHDGKLFLQSNAEGGLCVGFNLPLAGEDGA